MEWLCPGPLGLVQFIIIEQVSDTFPFEGFVWTPFWVVLWGREGDEYRIRGERWVSMRIEYVRFHIFKKKKMKGFYQIITRNRSNFIYCWGNPVTANKAQINPVSRLITSSDEFHIEFLPKRSLQILQWILGENVSSVRKDIIIGELKKACGSGIESGNGLPFVKIEYHSPP